MTSQKPQGYRIQDVFLSLREVWKRDVVYFRVMLKPILEIHYCPKQLSRNGGFHLFLSQLITGGACYEISLSLDSFAIHSPSPWSHFCSHPHLPGLQSSAPAPGPVLCVFMFQHLPAPQGSNAVFPLCSVDDARTSVSLFFLSLFRYEWSLLKRNTEPYPQSFCYTFGPWISALLFLKSEAILLLRAAGSCWNHPAPAWLCSKPIARALRFSFSLFFACIYHLVSLKAFCKISLQLSFYLSFSPSLQNVIKVALKVHDLLLAERNVL